MHNRRQPNPRATFPALACSWLLGALLLAPAVAVAGEDAGIDSGTVGGAENPPPAGEWHQFRGPDRSGRSAETGLLHGWPEGGPPVLWERELGEGFSSFSVSGDRLYTQFAVGEEEFLGCFRRSDGEELWRQPVGEKFHENFGNGPRATPTLDGDTVYALGGKGRLIAADAGTGEVRWQLELTEKYGIRDPQTLNPMASQEGLQLPLYGYSGSPLVVGELLIAETGARHGRSVVALDKATGEERWTALDEEIGYASPILVELDGQRQIVALPGNAIVGLSLDGELLWRHPWAVNPSQPVLVPPDKIFVSTVSDQGALLLRVDGGGDGEEAKVEEVWRVRRFRNAWNSSILHRGYIYGFDNATLRCIDAATGELQWATRGLGQGNLIYADGLLIGLSDRGKLVLVEPTPEEYRELGSVQLLEGRSWTPPTLADGILYLRNHEKMVAVDLRDGSTGASDKDPEKGEAR
jgi:outer membrane protein assembly factor BamB